MKKYYYTALVILSWLDAISTLYSLSVGRIEANPINAFYLSHGLFVFFIVRCFIVPLFIIGTIEYYKISSEHFFYFFTPIFVFWILAAIQNFFGII